MIIQQQYCRWLLRQVLLSLPFPGVRDRFGEHSIGNADKAVWTNGVTRSLGHLYGSTAAGDSDSFYR